MSAPFSTPAPTLPGRAAVSEPGAARRLLWVTFWLVAAAVGIGTTWDGWWHATHVFQGFFSPPHTFFYAMYAMCVAASGVTLAMALNPSMRAAFGPRIPRARGAVRGGRSALHPRRWPGHGRIRRAGPR